jgi:hypothetical protein
VEFLRAGEPREFLGLALLQTPGRRASSTRRLSLEPVVCTPSGETGVSERRLTFTLRTSLEMFGSRTEYFRGGFIVFRKAFVN